MAITAIKKIINRSGEPVTAHNFEKVVSAVGIEPTTY